MCPKRRIVLYYVLERDLRESSPPTDRAVRCLGFPVRGSMVGADSIGSLILDGHYRDEWYGMAAFLLAGNSAKEY